MQYGVAIVRYIYFRKDKIRSWFLFSFFYFYSPNLSFSLSLFFFTSYVRKSIKYYKPCLYRSTIPGNKSGQASINFAGPNSCTINSSTTVSPWGKSGRSRIHGENTRIKCMLSIKDMTRGHQPRLVTVENTPPCEKVISSKIFLPSSSSTTFIDEHSRIRDYNHLVTKYSIQEEIRNFETS